MNGMKYAVFAMAFLAVSLSTANSADARIIAPFTHPDIDSIILGRTTDQQQRTVGDCSQYCRTEYLTTVEVIESYYGDLTGTVLVHSSSLPYTDAYVPRPDRIALLGLTLYDGEYNSRFDISYIAGIDNLAERIQNRFGVTVDANPRDSIVTVGYKIFANLWLDEKISDSEFASLGGVYTVDVVSDGGTVAPGVPEYFETTTR